MTATIDATIASEFNIPAFDYRVGKTSQMYYTNNRIINSSDMGIFSNGTWNISFQLVWHSILKFLFS